MVNEVLFRFLLFMFFYLDRLSSVTVIISLLVVVRHSTVVSIRAVFFDCRGIGIGRGVVRVGLVGVSSAVIGHVTVVSDVHRGVIISGIVVVTDVGEITTVRVSGVAFTRAVEGRVVISSLIIGVGGVSAIRTVGLVAEGGLFESFRRAISSSVTSLSNVSISGAVARFVH